MLRIEEIVASKGFARFGKYLVICSGVLTLVALVLKYVLHDPMGGELLVIGQGGLACYFFFVAYRTPKNRFRDLEKAADGQEEENIDAKYREMSWSQRLFTSEAMNGFLHKILCWGLTIALIGLLYLFNRWPGGDVFTIVGGSILAVAGICYLIRYLLTRDIR